MSKPYDPRDRFYKKAKQEGFRARSAYKLQEIAKRFSLFPRGARVLDLGAAPGGWLQVIGPLVGGGGVVVGLDLERIPPVAGPVKTAVLDLRAPDVRERIRELHDGPFDVVTSDMAPKTTGIRGADEARSIELARIALGLAKELLVPGGSFVAKVFEGGELEGNLRDVKAAFGQEKLVRPEATRDRSREIFVVARSLREPSRPT